MRELYIRILPTGDPANKYYKIVWHVPPERARGMLQAVLKISTFQLACIIHKQIFQKIEFQIRPQK